MQWLFGLSALVMLSACGAQLPEGWEGAERVTLTQRAMGSPSPEVQARFEATAASKAIDVRLLNAHFRCEQAVEGYVRRSAGKVELLVQPEEMEPSSVVRCDSLYDVRASLPATSGEQQVSVYTRSDSYGSEPAPVLVGTKAATVGM